MSTSFVTTVTIRCDAPGGCGRAIEGSETESAADIREWAAKSAGWDIGDDGDYCPGHKPAAADGTPVGGSET